jgi:uncharacterized protein YjbI with pentapeptide repeats
MPLVSALCIFHDNDYLHDKTNNDEHKRAVLNRLKRKANYAISDNEPLLCIGFQLPDFSLSDLSISKRFTKPAYFNDSQFLGKADFFEANFQERATFSDAKFQGEARFYKANFQGEAFFSYANFQGEAFFFEANFQERANFYFAKFRVATFSDAKFQGEADFSDAKFLEAFFYKANFQERATFSDAKFQGEADFSDAKFQGEADFINSEFYGKTYFSGEFNGKTKFHYVLFEAKEKVIFKTENLSNVSFMNTDLTGVRFSDKARWGGGGEDTKEDKFKIIDERLLKEKIKEKEGHTTEDFNLGSIKAVYRNLRENYEYRMRYDEADQFFIREMELKRKYREVPSREEENSSLEIKQNNWFRRNLFSLTGWYYHLSRYGESIWRPTLAGLVIVILSTLFWLTQSNATLQPSLLENNPRHLNTANFTGTANFTNINHLLKSFERSFAGFIPLLPMGGDIKVGVIDYLIKIVGGAVTFGLIAIALRRRFERRYRH